MKKAIPNILKYYLEYEISNILNSSELILSDQSMILTKEEIKNVKQEIAKIKEKKIEEKIKKFIGRKAKNIEELKTEIKQELLKLELSDEDEILIMGNIKNKIKESLYEKVNIKEKALENFIYYLCSIMQSQQFYLYAHYITYINSKKSEDVKQLPIFIFTCEIDGNNIEILESNVNPETLNILLSVILKKDITEVVLDYGDEIANYRKEIMNTIDGGDVFHLIDLYYAKLGEYTGVTQEQVKNIHKIHAKYKMNEEYIIALEELASQSIKNIKEDLETLIEIINNDNYVPKILDKYLENAGMSKKDIDDKKYKRSYLGNYKNEYGVSQIQYEIVNAIKDNDITAIEGPPGTGKTSLLKEIIANNVVERANLILKNWNENLEHKKSKIEYYDINWFHENEETIKSIVVSSKNGEAIENVGKEINKEIKYLFPIARKYERFEKKGKNKEKVLQQYKGMVCLPLGKQDNIISFKDFLYDLFLPMLDRIEGNSKIEILAEKVKNQYTNKLKEIEEFEKIIKTQTIMKDRKKYFYGIEILREDEKEERKTKIQNIEKIFLEDAKDKENKYEEIKNEKVELGEKIEKQKQEINKLEKKKQEIEQKIAQSQNEKSILKSKITELEKGKKHIEEISKSLLQKILQHKYYKENKNMDFDSLINENISKQETEDKKIDKYLDQQNEIENTYLDKEHEKNELEKQFSQISENFATLEQEIKEIKIIKIFNKFNGKTFWEYSNIVDIYGHSKLNQLNQELFLLALKLNELYIAKNSKEIKHNLEMFLEGTTTFICKSLYDSSDMYPKRKQEIIKSLWNTVFLCFPVVTTTLDSFCKRCFHLVPEYIDLELIDEAGQILPHNLVPALYRGKKVVIVGDVNQIEPIYSNVAKKFEEHQNIIGNNFENIKIENNSVQALANKNTDILSNQEPIMLNEHYRCERNIVNFSNKYVYHNRLNMNKKDDMEKPFFNNMVAIDIRGKEEKDEHVNTLEIEACIETIKYILQKNEGKNPTIAVITPFKNQTGKIEDRLNAEGLKNIKVGTVHAFQGQEKEYIIFSQVIDSPMKRRITDFIGGKGNMLNVAVTRAKKQFIFIGNIEVALKTRNYLTKLIEYIRKNGELYSLYYKENEVSEHVFDDEILKILQPEIQLGNDKIGLYIQSHFVEGILHDAKKHYEFLQYAIENAQKEIYIMSPWYKENVINDSFIESIKKLQTKGGTIRINFGYNKGNKNVTNAKELADELSKTRSLGFTSKEMAEEIANKMYENIGKENFVYAPPTHAKIVIIDNQYMCIGSHNWLSNAGKTNESERKKEVSRLTTSKKAIEYVKEKIFE